MSPALWALPHDKFRTDHDSITKSLTPQRKHRKLLKDGSGVEVWPESVEKVFVEGLRKYWESPYATSQSRGRSRWRNQFLVDYLKSNGIDRTKKQVASHIQVLRNMWKGEPEFYLVAGGEELGSDQAHAKVKAEDQGDHLFLGYPDYDDAESSSNGTSPNFSPPEVKTEFPPSPGTSLRAFPPDNHTTFYSSIADGLSVPSNSPSMLPSRAQRSAYMDPSQLSSFTTNYDYSASSDFTNRFGQGIMPSQTGPLTQSPKVKALKLIVDGSSPSWVRLDTLTSLGQMAPHSPLTLKIKLATPANDIMASLYFSNWIYSAKCATRVFINGHMETPDSAPLTFATSGEGYPTAVLPGSRLNQYRWLEPSIPVVVTQEITIDDRTLLFIIYILDRTNSSNSACAQLLGFSKFHHNDKTAAAQLSLLPTPSDQQALNALNGQTSLNLNSYLPSTQCNRYSLYTSMPC